MKREPSAANLRFLSYYFGGIILAICGFIGWYTWILSSNLCKIPVGVEKYAGEQSRNNVTEKCFNLLNEQVQALSNTLYIFAGTLAISVVVYVVIVWAGARFSGSVGPTGVNAEMDRSS